MPLLGVDSFICKYFNKRTFLKGMTCGLKWAICIRRKRGLLIFSKALLLSFLKERDYSFSLNSQSQFTHPIHVPKNKKKMSNIQQEKQFGSSMSAFENLASNIRYFLIPIPLSLIPIQSSNLVYILIPLSPSSPSSAYSHFYAFIQ